jgi:predicted CopG family antitoxin
MGTKNITITEEAYERLRALKRDDESFSELVTRLTEREDPMAFAGSCPNLGEYVDETGSDINDDLQEQQDELFG